DVYAVGATALSVLTGEEPENLPHLGLKLDVARALPHEPELARLIERLVEPDPDRRPRNIRPLLRELEGAAAAPPSTPRARVSVPPEARKGEVHSRPDWQRPPLAAEPLPRVVVLVCVIGLTLAQKAVRLTVGMLVPLLLVMLSLVFGHALRLAARNVRSAAHRADDALWRAKRLVRRIQIAQDRPDPWAHTGPRRRVAQDGEQPRHRARVVDTTAEDLHDFEEHDAWESSESRGRERDWTRGSRSKR
ncbi:MAG TPA: serine/threonine protein kinase, partial [Polyangiaceae bacterium]